MAPGAHVQHLLQQKPRQTPEKAVLPARQDHAPVADVRLQVDLARVGDGRACMFAQAAGQRVGSVKMS